MADYEIVCKCRKKKKKPRVTGTVQVTPGVGLRETYLTFYKLHINVYINVKNTL